MLRFALLTCLAVVAPHASGGTWIVDAAGGGHFSDLPPAVAVAADDDLILIRSGTYTATPIDKPLRIIGGYQGGTTVLNGRTQIYGIGVGELFLLSDLTLSQNDPLGGTILTLSSCTGVVFVNRCNVLSSNPLCTSSGVGVFGCPNVIWKDGQVTGVALATPQRCSHPTSGINLSSSDLVIYGGHIVGLDGSDTGFYDGHSGLTLSGSSVVASGTFISGGHGRGNPPPITCGNGGRGIASWSTRDTVTEFGTTVHGGIGGSYLGTPCGNPGLARHVTGQGTFDPQALPTLSVSSHLPRGGTATVDAEVGVGGASAVFMSFGLNRLNVPGVRGPWWLDLSFALHVFTATGTVGSHVQVPVPIPNDPNLDGVFVAFQGYDFSGSLTGVAAGCIAP